eukprot:scaffold10870_cov84-Cyclotella_meneghiniana.AAC.6
MAFTSPSSTKCSNRFTTSYDRRHGIFQPSLSTDGIVDDSEDVFVGTPMKSFSATPITLSIKQPPKEIVNSATLRFNNRLNDMSKNIDAGTASKVETLLLTALAKYEQYTNSTEYKQTNSIPKELVVPNTISFTNAITAWARSTRKDAPYKAEELLNRMHTLYSSGMTHVRPNKISYNSVINAWAKNKNKEYKSGSRAERLLYRLFEFYQEEGGCDEDLCPDARSFNSVINTVARSREENCADRAKFLLDEMGRLYNEGNTELLPHAYANSMEEGASDKAAQLLQHMESLYQLGFDNAKPTTFVYNACMNAFAKDPFISDLENDAAGKAEQLLVSMEKRYDTERDGRTKPDCISYRSRHVQFFKDSFISPLLLQSTVINAYANSATIRSGKDADRVLKKMLTRYLLGDYNCRPNAVAFTATIKAHSAAINATMASPDNINAQYSKEVMQSSASRCEDLLLQLLLLRKDYVNDKSLKPTAVTYDLVLWALQQVEDSDGVKRVQLLRSNDENNNTERIPKFRGESRRRTKR